MPDIFQKERAKYGFKNRFRMVFKQNGHKTYDFSPFPYCPIILESTVRLTDRPNCITFPTSAAKQDYGSFILDAVPQRITQGSLRSSLQVLVKENGFLVKVN